MCPEAVAADELAAQKLAIRCDVPVEVLSEADETTKVTALPSGNFVLEAFAEPQRVQRGGRWIAVDTRLQLAADGKFRPQAAADVAFSAGGSGPFATYRGAGAEFSLSWPTPLPAGVPAGDTVTYPNVYPDVDLVVRAAAGGFSHTLVVRTAAAAGNPAVRESRYLVGGTAGVTESAGVLTIAGPSGRLARSARATAWDSRAKANVRTPGDAARPRDVKVSLTGRTLTVKADPALFAGKPAYPIYIDPTYSSAYAKWAPLNDSNPDTSWTSGSAWPREDIRVGSNYDNNGDLWRAVTQFNVTALKGKRVINTPSVEAYATHSASCAGESLTLWHTGTIDGHTPTWDGMSGQWLDSLQTVTVKANGSSCGQNPNWVKFTTDVKTKLQSVADANGAAIGFGFRVPTESGGNWIKLKPGDVKLLAEYQSKPSSPVATRTSPGGNCSASPGPWINDNTPLLYGKAADADGTVRVKFGVTGPTTSTYTSGFVAANTEAGWTTGNLNDGAYNWHVLGTDNVDSTGWSGTCYFRVDATKPTAPYVRRTSTGAPKEGDTVTLEFSSSDAGSGMQRFAYGIGVDAEQASVTSTGTASISFAVAAGRTSVYVWARDNAGNISDRTEFNFFTGRITAAEPVAAYRFNEDARDDSGAGHDLTLHGDATFGPDRAGHPTAALGVTGAGCTGTGGVVRSDGEFTIAGWAKLHDKSNYRTLAAITGNRMVSLMIEYNPLLDRWEVSYTTADSDSPGWLNAIAPSSPPLNTWQHLAMTADPVAKLVRLYVNGTLAAEAAAPNGFWNGNGLRIGCAGSSTGFGGYEMNGEIDNVGVWQGLLSEEQIRRAATELPAGPAAAFEFKQDEERPAGTNLVVADNPATVRDGATYTDDQFGHTNSALDMNHTADQCVRTSRSVIHTDESFSVAVWGRITSGDAQFQTFVSQEGQHIGSWYLGARDGRFSFHLKNGDSNDSTAYNAYTAEGSFAANVGKWIHLAAVYDATSRTMALYFDGKLVTRIGAPALWDATGPLVIGCSKFNDGPADLVAGAISDVQVWRGALTDADIAAVRGNKRPVKLEGRWPFDGPSSDEPTYLQDLSGNHRDLTIAGEYGWGDDRGNTPDSSLSLDLTGNSCAASSGPAVRTDGSFTVATWVLLDELGGTRTLLAQSGAAGQAFRLEYDGTAARWRFVMPHSDGSTTLSEVRSDAAAEPGAWTHLAATYDLGTNSLRLYVNGVRQGAADVAGPPVTWHADGPLTIGCAATKGGQLSGYLGGLIDDTRIWTNAVEGDIVANLASA
ncbi:LamG domain-containing protein [Paractinoplanes toevensis]|uniref:LamG domain-containing protein n=1 Tax=Paractinoplanes toevensis TaxID=571911 RepID=UPI001BB36FDB|nr:LamG domain-containing protein [Actinoplanes toevensis]